ncbi:MAG: hypothetical protein Q8Q89_04870 [bacterium]|nr:hypothetical protein [bacterium]
MSLNDDLLKNEPYNIPVLSKEIVRIRVDILGCTAYCFFQYLPAIDRGLVIVDIFSAIRRYWPYRKLNLQLDPAWALDSYRIGVIVQADDDNRAL